jgi:class I fructose-bisphosphate aldolase
MGINLEGKQIGKKIRLERLFNRETGKIIIIPMDHGVTIGPVAGLIEMKDTINEITIGGANAIVIHKGIVAAGHRGGGPDVGLIIHLSASTSLSPFTNTKTIVCSVEEAIKLGADGVSIHVNLGDENEREMLKDFGEISKKAFEWGMPLLAMVYPRGPKIKDSYDPDIIAHCARLGAEMGADVVKVSYTGSTKTFKKVVEGCPVPVVIAGGPKMDSDRAVIEMVKGAIEAGGAGVSIGRNVFQHPNPRKIVHTIAKIVHQNVNIEEAMKELEA